MMHLLYNLLMISLTCGQVFTAKIYGGKEAQPHSRPYMALLEMTNSDGTEDHCAGFLLTEDFVMTAAHCQASSYQVYLGLHDYRRKDHNVQNLSVEETFPGKDYNGTDHTNDIMLLKLSSKATFNNHVKPIDLAGAEDKTPKLCSVSGWGRFKSDSDYMSPVLREANVTLDFNSLCRNDNFYCSKGQSGPGNGDSGSPLVCEDGKVYGVMSHGTSPDSNGVRWYRYAKVSKKTGLMN